MGMMVNPYRYAASGPVGPPGPIAFVGHGTIAVAGTGPVNFSFTNLLNTAGSTASIASGDFAILTRVEGNLTDGIAVGDIAGWTKRQDLFVNESIDCYHTIYTRTLDGTETSVTLQSSAAAGAAVAGNLMVFRGGNTFDVADVVTSGLNTGQPNAAAITPVTAGTWIVVSGAASGGAGSAFTNPGDLSATTNHFRSIFGNGSTNDAISGMGIKTDWSSGAFDPTVWGGGNTNSNSGWSAVTMALKSN